MSGCGCFDPLLAGLLGAIAALGLVALAIYIAVRYFPPEHRGRE